MFRSKSWLAAGMMLATLAACGGASPAYALPIHSAAVGLVPGAGHEPAYEPRFYRPQVSVGHNRLSQKGKRKRARWVR